MKKLPRHVSDPNPYVYLSNNAYVLDFETTNIDKGNPCNPDNSLILACARHVGTGEIIVSWGNEFEQKSLLERLYDSDYIIAHNTKFELGWLKRCGGGIERLLPYCTLLAEYVQDGNVRKKRGLEGLCHRYGLEGKKKEVAAMLAEGICPSKILPEWLEEYCLQDVNATYEIFIKQRSRLVAMKLLPVAYTRNLLTPVLADIEFNGMQLDKERVNKVYRKYRNELDEVTRELVKITGAINLNSPEQLGNFIYDVLKFREPRNHYGKPIKTPGGKRTTNSKHLAKLKPMTVKQTKFLDLYKKQAKLDDAITKYLSKFKECCENDLGILRAAFNQHVTVTHRLSSAGESRYKAQFHNMDRSFKPLFRARRKGWRICESDQAQLEYRVAVWLGDDKLGRERIASGFDVHRHTANIMTSAGQPTDRQEGKAHCFPLNTDILTPSGWKRYNQINVGDTIINYDANRGVLTKDIVVDYAAPSAQPVVRMRTKHNWCVESTGQHRWYGQKYVDHGHYKKWHPVVSTTNELNSTYRIITSAPYDSDGVLTPDEAAFLGWCYSDGNVRVAERTNTTSQGSDGRRQRFSVTLIQKQGKHQEQVIDNLLSRLSIRHKKNIDLNNICRWVLSSCSTRPIFIKAGIRNSCPDHVLLVLAMARGARERWLDSVKLAEGTLRAGDTWRIAQNSGNFCEAIKLAGFLCGHDIRTTKVIMKYNGNSHEQITLRKKSYVGCSRVKKINMGDALVWCVETKNKTVVIRQGDTITISGNTFKPLFFGSSGTPAEQAYYKAFKEEHKGISAVHDKWIKQVLKYKYLQLPTGFRAYWPDTRMTSTGYVTNSTQICNYPVQHLATAEIVPIGLVYLWHLTKAHGMLSFIVNTVHDSVEAEVPPDEVEKFQSLCSEAMVDKVLWYLKKVYGITFDVPLALEQKATEFWNDSPEWQQKYLN